MRYSRRVLVVRVSVEFYRFIGAPDNYRPAPLALQFWWVR